MIETLLSQAEQDSLRDAVRSVSEVPGDIVEIGVYQGGSAKIICEVKGDKELHLFDTFEGIKEIHPNDLKSRTRFNVGRYSADRSIAEESLKGESVHFHQGIFPETWPKLKQVSLLHLDVDLYDPTKAALEIIWPLIPKGGKVVLHDYPSFEGVRLAVDEVLGDIPKEQITGEQAIITK